ncbi:efflux RND transporter periplasmic adaptor subunit [Desulfohalovibrio reitneri]|uniref:efflux RND transporter periplasmic adaptor subunit n=1 Tax=Desulfohalovibrio reitneri TaxID=1307759 RepID=UPI0004A76BE0|nr:efflux RND transporter periplasmic adaptor subunit [Desulfohalovibrio reitneri]
MFKRLFIISILLGGLFGGVFWYHGYIERAEDKAMADYTPPPTVVTAAKVKKQAWVEHIHAVGEVFSLSSSELSPEASGKVTAIRFESGERVEAGQPLVDVSHRVETTSMGKLKANEREARKDYQRYKDLYQRGVVAKATLDKYRTAFEDARSQVHAQTARIERNSVKAPFSGTVGICNIEMGDFVDAGQPLLRLTKLSPIYIDFAIRQQDLSKVSTGQIVKAKVDAWPGETFHGELTSINPFLSKKTRRIHARATFDNKQGKLLPGMFCSVSLVMPDRREVFTAPTTSVTYRMSGNTVYLLKPKKTNTDKKGKESKPDTIYTAKEVLVKAGPTRKGRTVIGGSISEGDLLVTSGQNKLYNGSNVKIDNSVNPAKAGK